LEKLRGGDAGRIPDLQVSTVVAAHWMDPDAMARCLRDLLDLHIEAVLREDADGDSGLGLCRAWLADCDEAKCGQSDARKRRRVPERCLYPRDPSQR
jgi:hypothetical protein